MYENTNNESILLLYAAAHQKIKILIVTCFLRGWSQSSFHSREAEVIHGLCLPCLWLHRKPTGRVSEKTNHPIFISSMWDNWCSCCRCLKRRKDVLDCVLFESTEVFATWKWQTLFLRLDQVGGVVILVKVTFTELSWNHLVSWSFPSTILIKIIKQIVKHDIFLWQLLWYKASY